MGPRGSICDLECDSNKADLSKRVTMKICVLLVLLGLTVAVYSELDGEFEDLMLAEEDEETVEDTDVTSDSDEALGEAPTDVEYFRVVRRSIRGRRIIRQVTDYCKKNPLQCIGAVGKK